MSTRSGLMVAAAAATVLVAGCATRATSIDARWVNPELVGKSAVTSVLVVSAVLLLAVLYVPFLQPVFSTVPLTWDQWQYILPLLFVPAIAAELTKWFVSRKTSE